MISQQVAGSVPVREPVRRRACLRAAIAVLLVAVLVRVAAFLAFADLQTTRGDERYYVARARSLVTAGRYVGALRPPGQSAVVAASFLLLGENLAMARLAQLAISLVTVVLVFDLVRNRAGLAAATASALLCALNPTLAHYSHLLWSETLYGMLLVLCVWSLERCERVGASRWGLAAGVALGLASLTRETAIYFLPLAAAWLALGERGGPAFAWRSRGAVLLTVGTLAVVAPWVVRNYVRYDVLAISTNRWRMIAQGNLEERMVPLLRARAGDAFVYRGVHRGVDRAVEREAIARELAVRVIVARQPGWILEKAVSSTRSLLATKSQLARFLKRGWLPDGSSSTAGAAVLAEKALLVILVSFGVAGLWLAGLGRVQALIAALVVMHWAIYIVTFAHHRFSVPLLPFLAMAAGPVLTTWPPWRGRPSWQVLGASASVIGLAALVW